MSVHYYFRDFDRLDHLELYLKDHIQNAIDSFIPSGKYNLTTRIQTIRKRNEFKKPKFLCEIQLSVPRVMRTLVIKKKSSDFYDAALQVAHALSKVLRKNSNKKSQHNRKGYNKISRLVESRLLKEEGSEL